MPNIPMSWADPERIVVLLPNWVGDVVMATPALRALRRRRPGSRVTLAGRFAALETLAGAELGDATVTDPVRAGGPARSLATFVGRLRAGRHDLAVLFPNSFRAALAVRLAGIRRVVGYARDGRSWLLSKALAPPRDEDGGFLPIPAIDYYIHLVALLGATCDSRRMHLPVLPDDARAADEMLHQAGADASRPIVMLNPGASFGVSKMWDPERYAVVADALMERRGAQIIINAAPGERRIAAMVARAMNGRPLLNFADRCNTLSLLKALVQRSALMITNDTGARHIAAALGVDVVTLFASTDPRWSEIDYPRERIVRAEVACAPCGQKLCAQAAGPQYQQCTAAITPEMVLRAAEELLGKDQDALPAAGALGENVCCRVSPERSR